MEEKYLKYFPDKYTVSTEVRYVFEFGTPDDYLLIKRKNTK